MEEYVAEPYHAVHQILIVAESAYDNYLMIQTYKCRSRYSGIENET